FSLENAQALLNAIDLTQVVNQGPRQATRAPTLLMLPKNLLELQRAGGTWRAMFNPGDLLNRYEPLGVLAWWLAMLVMGWLAFPLTYLVFGGLADRGYPLAKSVALLFVAWLVWMLGSYEILPFSRGTIALGFIVLALISGVIFWLRRAEIGDYLRRHRRHILIVEGLTLALFVFDLLIRLGNPDLWHPAFGGEKPMVFSFFNAVLKSTYFPPYDPWLAGGYINYYYYGFVIVALLTKLLGLVPAFAYNLILPFAYNLILPMLFSLLGVNAFCVAYNLVKARSENPASASQAPNPNPEYSIPNPQVTTLKTGDLEHKAQEGNPAPRETILNTQTLEWMTEGAQPAIAVPAAEVETPTPLSGAQAVSNLPSLTLTPNSNSSPVTRHLSPYIAGLAAALLIVVLGSLGQIWFLNRALQEAADPQLLSKLAPADRDITTTLNGLGRVLSGKASLPGGGRWYWDATRIVAYANQDRGEGGGNEINEFPFFTFLYADLHAHMMDLPFTVLALAWGVAYVLGIQRRRSRLESVALWFVGGLALGVARPTNTWDFPTYLALGVAAVAAAHWLRDPRITRANLSAVGGRLVLLVGLAMALYRPFDQWFLSPYSEAVQWKGPKTPLDAYLYMYGLFFFILVSFLVWEARRWLAETPARVLTENRNWLAPVGLLLAALVTAIAVFLYLKADIAVIALPLMAWAGLLLLRSRAAMPPEKRIVLFLIGTALSITLFVEVYAVGGDRMNTVFKLGMQVWTLFSVGAGAALGWVWAERPAWTPNWRGAWTLVLIILAGSAAFYTVTAANAKVRDRFPSSTAQPHGTQNAYCQEIPGVPMPYPGNRGRQVDEQPHSLNGMDYLQWSAYCDQAYFLPLKYDYDAMRWMQDNVKGSPVIVEAQSFALYRMSSRYAWNTGLPDVVGWDWHQRQERGALPTQFISERGAKVSLFYCVGAAFGPQDLERYQACAGTLSYYQEAGSLLENPGQAEDYALSFIRDYDAHYVVVGPMERAYYPPEGLAKFDTMVARGLLTVAYHNPGVTIYEVTSALAGQ
ncbi:MAG: putative rane protein, partial [Anaerolineales bacterium]|nr:putative rane protein [Anaerolineales bacterium]